jgi:3-isopropylmalate/(R)-2-methylmalate dehydratase small subunit
MNSSIITKVSARALPLRGDEIDTDRIIPARYLRCVSFDGLGEFAFRDERYDASGAKKVHAMNESRFAGAGIMVVNRNFGCGSSREHAPQALSRWGIKALVGESFADIFAGNCAAIGVVAVTASSLDIARLQAAVEAFPNETLTLDLEAMTASMGDLHFRITMPESHRRNFLAGTWDTVGALLANKDSIQKTAGHIPYLAGFGTRKGAAT